jgi:hypothetical protein
VLQQLDVAALLVHPALLVLAEAVDRFVVRGLEALTHTEIILAFDFERRE